MMFAFSKANHSITCNGKISNSTIDMNGGIITAHGLPQTGTDVVNKNFIDTLLIKNQVSLIDTDETLVSTATSGTFMMIIKNVVFGGPSGGFMMSKNESVSETSFTRLVSSPGINSEEKINLRWSPGQGIYMSKSGLNYNGLYNIKLILI